jgi:AcrR family transcriptional regulator
VAGDVKRNRRYHSPRRQQQAAETRRAILDAADELFAERGYASTTVAAIAAHADVATKTVYFTFETKGAVLRALWNLRLRGDEEGVPVAERDWYRKVLDEPDPERKLRLNARNSRRGKVRIGGIANVIRAAADVDPEVAALWDRIESDYRENQRAVVVSLRELKALRPGLTVEHAADALWLLNHPNQWHLLVVRRGWSPNRYERWTGDTACSLLLR